MDLIHPAAVRSGRSHGPEVDHGAAFEKIFQQDGTTGAINASQTAYEPPCSVGFLFCFPEEAAGFPVRMGWGGFIDPFPSDLRVNAGAGSKKESLRLRKSRPEVPAAFEIDGPVVFCSAAAATGGTVNDLDSLGGQRGSNRLRSHGLLPRYLGHGKLSEGSNGSGIREVASKGGNACIAECGRTGGMAGESHHGQMVGEKFPGQKSAEVSTSGDNGQEGHREESINRRLLPTD
jgi:hypothetical protein